MSVITLRLASLADADEISDLLDHAYGQLLRGAYEDAVIDAALPYLTEADYDLLGSDTFRVAESGGQIVGCGGWTPWAPGTAEETPGLAHVRQLATHPSFLRRGIAARLLRECLAEAAEEGYERAQVLASLVSVPLYERAGFTAVERDAIALSAEVELPVVRMVAAISWQADAARPAA